MNVLKPSVESRTFSQSNSNVVKYDYGRKDRFYDGDRFQPRRFDRNNDDFQRNDFGNEKSSNPFRPKHS